MKQYKPINLVAVLLVSFVAWVYCVAPAVLGLIYQAYPGQDSVSVLIATLPTVVTMIVAFLSTVIFRFVPRKWMAITSMVIALICGAVILIFPPSPSWASSPAPPCWASRQASSLPPAPPAVRHHHRTSRR